MKFSNQSYTKTSFPMYASKSLELWTWLNIRSTIANHTYRQLLRWNEAQKVHTYPDRTIKSNLSFLWTVYVSEHSKDKITVYVTEAAADKNNRKYNIQIECMYRVHPTSRQIVSPFFAVIFLGIFITFIYSRIHFKCIFSEL